MRSLCALIVNSWWADQSSDLFPAWWLTSFCQGRSNEWWFGSLESLMWNWVLVWNLWNSDSGWMGFNHYWKWAKLGSRATSKPSALLEVIKNILPPAWLPEGINFVEGGCFLNVVEPFLHVRSYWKKNSQFFAFKNVCLGHSSIIGW